MLTEVDREWRGPFEAAGPMPTGFAPTATASRGAALVVIVLGGSRRGGNKRRRSDLREDLVDRV
jgi:hypothetical protein